MGVYKVVEISYKKGLLKKLYDMEQKKQYKNSLIRKDGKKSEFRRGDWYDSEDFNYDRGFAALALP